MDAKIKEVPSKFQLVWLGTKRHEHTKMEDKFESLILSYFTNWAPCFTASYPPSSSNFLVYMAITSDPPCRVGVTLLIGTILFGMLHKMRPQYIACSYKRLHIVGSRISSCWPNCHIFCPHGLFLEDKVWLCFRTVISGLIISN